MTATPVSLVTGASRGIGRAIALELARLGHVVLVNYVRRQDAADDVVAAIHRAGGHAIGVQGDVARSDDRHSLIERALQFGGRLDVLVNNAGITSPGRNDLLDATEENWDQVLGTNLKGPFFLAQLAAQRMIELIRSRVTPGGKIINISSISAYAMSTDRADYCIAKAGMGAMTWLLADRLATEKIQVFEICPGLIATDMTAPVREKYDQQLAAGLVPLRRWGQPEDVARAVRAIVDDALPYSTGERINVDGGFHLRRL
jgi:NAD(P)-dependent dehydrogenase (short-subunit alcohol dehydrogenase family)